MLYVYNSGEAIDGTTGITVGTKGAVQVGLQKGNSAGAWCIQVSAEISSSSGSYGVHADTAAAK